MKNIWFVGTLLLLLASPLVVGSSLAQTENMRLTISGLRLPRGAQTARLTGRLPPAPPVRRPIQVTLTLGGTRVALTGTALRDGRFSAQARRVDLLSAGSSPHGGQLQILGPAINEAIVVDSRDCVVSPSGATRTCWCADCQSPTPVDELPDGTYELVSPDFQGPGLARITTGILGERRLELFRGLFEGATLDVSPTFLLRGDAMVGGEAFVSALGSANASRSAAGWRVDGVIESPGGSGPALSWAFTLERPDAGTATAFAGTWRLELRRFADVLGTIPFTLAVAADGNCTTQPTSVVDPLNASYAYQLSEGSCRVAPAGQLSCTLGATGPPRVLAMLLHGQLDLAAGSGSGDFYVGPMVTQGSWTATRP